MFTSAAVSSLYVTLQTCHQCIECHPAAWAVAQVFVHADPSVHFKREAVRQHSAQTWVALGQLYLAPTDAGTGADHCQLRQVAVATDGEGVALKTLDCQAADKCSGLIKADDGVAGQVVHVLGMPCCCR